MRNTIDLQKGCGLLLKELRESHNLSVSKMADLMKVDRRTWQKYEDGFISPSVIDFISFFDVLGKDALRPVLDFLYPDIYKGLSASSDITDLRNAAIHYLENIASDRFVRECVYIVMGSHGSNIEPQLQEFTMIDHLPLFYRYAIAEQVLIFWRLATTRNELIAPDHVMPDIDLFMEGLEKGINAIRQGKESYTTSIERRTTDV